MAARLANREQAAQLLAQRLLHLRGQNGVVLAVPRGGVPIGAVLANALIWPLELALSKKIGHPANAEFAIGAVSEDSFILAPDIELPADYIDEQVAYLQQQLRARRRHFMGSKPPLPLTGRTILITDDGVATGHTLLATLALVQRQQPARVVVAVPVAAPEALRRIQAQADEVVCLLVPAGFHAVGQFYDDFSETTDAEVERLVQQHTERL
jgi:predicted phosphoribosyltransferase